MLLGRLRIRGKLALLVLLPLVAMIALAVANTAQLIGSARRAGGTATAVRVASLTGSVVLELQEERLISIGLLRGDVERGQVLILTADVTESVVTMRRELGEDMPAESAVALDGLKDLDSVRAGVLGGSITIPTVLTVYGTVISRLIDSTRLLEAVDGDTAEGRQVVALDAVLRANEAFATTLAVIASARTPAEMMAYAGGLAVIQPAVTRFVAYATREQIDLYVQATQGVDARLGPNFSATLVASPTAALSTIKTIPPFAAIESLSAIGVFVEAKIVNDVRATATEIERDQNAAALGFAALSLAAILGAVLLGVAVVRSVSRPLARLTQSAERVARLAESELVRVADDDSLAGDPIRLQPIAAEGRDELADLARAFGRVQDTAAQLVERQVASRRNVALMFGHVGRRTQNLVGRQVALIDKLENDETEPQRLRELYRLDHMSSRLRRSASSLVVLSGATGADEHMTPLGLTDVIRLALAEIEDYPRVDVEVQTSAHVAPALINDAVLLIAELMENATAFSPPGTRVLVTAMPTPDGARVTIVDHGLGMSPERLAEENARLTHRERLDLAPTEVLGLFVVGRLARRHALGVTLSSTRDGGVTATVDLPARLLTAPGPPATVIRAEIVTPTPTPRSVEASLVGLADADPELFNVGALTRASRTMLSVRPWNAFAPSQPSTVAYEVEPSAPRPAIAATGSTGLNRRVPGATLSSLDDAARRPVPSRPHQTSMMGQPSGDAEQARDSLAQFEAGIARAMREVNRPSEEGSS